MTSQQLYDTVAKASESLKNIASSFDLQVLGNLDSLVFALLKEMPVSMSDAEKNALQGKLEFLAEHMLKSPIRKQTARVRSAARALEATTLNQGS